MTVSRVRVEKSEVEKIISKVCTDWKDMDLFCWQYDDDERCKESPEHLIAGFSEFIVYHNENRIKGYKKDKHFLLVRQKGDNYNVVTNVEPQTDDPFVFNKNSTTIDNREIQHLL